MLMGTMLASVLMVMALSVGAMLMSMGMFVLMFMIVRLSRFMQVFMAVDVLMGMGTFHGWYSFETGFPNPTIFSWSMELTRRCIDCSFPI
jgi:hypothetical protein